MGLDLGLEKAGLSIVGCIEANPSACRTIRKNRPGLPLLESDVSALDPADALEMLQVRSVDAIVGGPPCQAFSVFGRRRGLEDKRGRVIFDYLRFVEQLRPKAFLMENVRGLLSTRLTPQDDKGSLLRLILQDFNRIGYRVDLFVVNSVNYGAPQIRERVFLIGNRLGLRAEFAKPTHSDKPVGGQEIFATLGDAIGNGFDDSDTSLMDFSDRKKKYLSMVPPGGNWRSLPTAIQKESMGKSFYLKGGRSAYWRRLSFDFPCPTVVTMPNHAGTSMCHPLETRALTLGECARVQGFPADWEFVGTPQERYKQVGNAVPVKLGEMAGKALIEMLRSKPAPEVLPAQNTERHIRPHVRTRQYWKNGKVFNSEPYRNRQDRSDGRVQRSYGRSARIPAGSDSGAPLSSA